MTFTYVVTYFLVTLVCSAICLVFLLQLSSDMGSEQEVRTFRNFILGYLAFAASNSIWVWINYGYLDLPGTPFSMINLVAICLASYYWFNYIEMRLNPTLASSSAFKVLAFVPLGIAIMLVTTSPLTGIVFHYEGHEYIHGPLYSTMAILALFYLIIATIHIGTYLPRTHSLAQRRQYYTLMLFLVFPMAGGIIDIFIENLPVMELMLLFGLILIYSTMQRDQIYNDLLTGLNNRRSADEYLQDRLDNLVENDPFYFMIGDIDQFKQINDQYGHIEGDRALVLTAEGLKRECEQVRCHIARWGGDEFVVIAESQNLADPEDLLANIDASLEAIVVENDLPYTLHLSFGYMKCANPSLKFNDVIRTADDHMYKSKRMFAKQRDAKESANA